MPANAPEAVLVSVLPEAPRKLVVTTTRRVRTGEIPELRLDLTAGGKPVINSLIRVDVMTPDGTWLPAHRQFVMNGPQKAPVVWPVALNAVPGTYRVVATELISGVTAEQKVSVRQP